MRQLFKGDNYLREETIRGNTVFEKEVSKYADTNWAYFHKINKFVRFNFSRFDDAIIQ